MARNRIFVTQVRAQHCVKAKNHVKQVLTVPDEAFGDPEAQSFDGPILSIKTNVAWCPHNTRAHHAK